MEKLEELVMEIFKILNAEKNFYFIGSPEKNTFVVYGPKDFDISKKIMPIITTKCQGNAIIIRCYPGFEDIIGDVLEEKYEYEFNFDSGVSEFIAERKIEGITKGELTEEEIKAFIAEMEKIINT